MSDDPKVDRKTVAIPNQIRDAMIVPNTHVPLPMANKKFGVLEQNWLFAQQWKKFDPTARNVVELKVGGNAADYLAAIKAASLTARGKEVILAAGHGGAGEFRGLTQTVFDSIPNAAHGLESHPFAITREVLDLPDIAVKKNGQWTPLGIKDPKSGVTTTVNQAVVDRLSPRFDMIATSGEIMRAAGVARFVILACNIGKDVPPPGKTEGFLPLLARILGVEAAAYGGLVAMSEVNDTPPGKASRTKEQIWIATDETNLENGRPPHTDLDSESFHEVPLTARVTAAAPAPAPAPAPRP